MIIVMGHLHLDPAYVAEFAADIGAVARHARTDSGCLFYSVVEDDTGDGRFLLAERWADQAALTAHLEAEPATRLFGKWGDRMRVDVAKFDAAHERALLD